MPQHSRPGRPKHKRKSPIYGKGTKKIKPDTSGLTYNSRNILLRLLGFSCYVDYLASHLWSDIKGRLRTIKGDDCTLCGRPCGWQHHHQRYRLEDLNGKILSQIHPICDPCHRDIEHNPDGSKRTFQMVRLAFMRARAMREKRWREAKALEEIREKRA